jgi:hypothetical protein
MTSWCEEYDGQAAADAFVVNHARLVAAEAREFVFYAHWASLSRLLCRLRFPSV